MAETLGKTAVIAYTFFIVFKHAGMRWHGSSGEHPFQVQTL
jgi:hypothetical protein